MIPLKIIVPTLLIFALSSCTTDAGIELSEKDTRDSVITTEGKQIDSGIKSVDYIPPIGTGESSAGNVKRDRKFYIR